MAQQQMADGTNAPLEFIPSLGSWDCSEKACPWTAPPSRPTQNFPYIWFGNLDEKDWDETYCIPWHHHTASIDELNVTTTISGGGSYPAGAGNITLAFPAGTIVASTSVTAPVFNGVATSAKSIGGSFDIPHVKDEKKRIRHVIAEGPEAGIYVRGTLKDSNEIKLPEYWDGLIDPETITVTLTQIGYSQDLIVENIEWGKVVKIKSGIGVNINCYYEIWAARHINPMDHSEKLHVVYEGDSPEDYPGNNEFFFVGGWDYDRRETKWRRGDPES